MWEPLALALCSHHLSCPSSSREVPSLPVLDEKSPSSSGPIGNKYHQVDCSKYLWSRYWELPNTTAPLCSFSAACHCPVFPAEMRILQPPPAVEKLPTSPSIPEMPLSSYRWQTPSWFSRALAPGECCTEFTFFKKIVFIKTYISLLSPRCGQNYLII